MQVLLYTWSSCSFCRRAKDLLDAHGIAFSEKNLDGDRAAVRRLTEWFGKAHMPFVLLDGEPLGGLAELERQLAQGGPG